MPGSRALVVGTGTHPPGSALPDIAAVPATVTAIGTALIERCGLAAEHLTTLTDPAGPRSLLDALTEATAAAQDVLLFYYVGHGLVSLGGELYLATSATTDQGLALAVDALSYATVRDALTTCPARSILVVLDCCFSGRAYGAFGTAVADAFELSYVRGSFLLTAASATEQALAPAGDRYTGFSGALLGLLRDGDPAAPRYLSAEDAYRYLSRVLPQRGLPAPHRRVGDRAGDLVLAVNPAAPPVVRPRPAPDASEHDGQVPAPPCPYRGLSAFTAADARYFRGRDELIADGLATVAARTGSGPVAFVGRSGSGKTSVLQAGLLPAVRNGRLNVPGSRRWPQIVLTPGEHPLRRLATRLAGPAALGAEPMIARLSADPGQLAVIASGALRSGSEDDMLGGRLLLCVDQFEELFTACPDPGERRAFVRALCAASRGPAAPLVVVLGIRADFYGHCMDFEELGPMLQQGQVAVRPMRTAELRAAIEGPAETAGLVIEDGLPDRLLQDLATGADAGAALPLLSYALQATWQLGDGRLLTLADYHATGGIWRAVTQRADRTYDALDDDARDAARLLLLSMVRLGGGTDDTRRRISVSDLLASTGPAHRRALAAARDAFIAARLITVADGEAELAHEALLRAWPRLRGWIEEDRADLLAHQHLTDAASNWAADGREHGSLYAGARLALARRWLAAADEPASRRGPLSSLEREFLTASFAAERRGRLRRRIAVATAAVVVVALAASGAFALQQRARDLASQAEQSSVQLAAAADALRSSDPAGALELSLTAYSTDPTAQARSSLYASYVTPFPVPLPLPARARRGGTVTSVAYSPDGTIVAAANSGGQVRLWRVSDPLHPVFAGQLAAGGHGAEVAFDGRAHVLIVHGQRALEIWDVASPAHPVRLSSVPVVAPVPQGAGQIVPLAVSPDGDLAATGNGDGRLRLWNITSPRHPVLDADVPVGRTALQAVAFSANGQVLATSSATSAKGPGGGRVRLWDVTQPHAPRLRSVLAVNSALSVAFSPVGHLLVAAGAGEDMHAWNTAHPRHPAPVTVNGVHLNGGAGGTSSIDSVAFRPDGQAFVTTDTGGDTYIWSAQNPTDVASLPNAVGTFTAAYSPNGRQLVTGDEGGTVELWTMLAPLLPGGLQLDWQGSPFGHAGAVLALDAPVDATGHPAGQATLWDIRDPARPTRLVMLPRSWPYAEFLPDGSTLVTVNATHTALRLWSTADPRRPVAGAVLPVSAGPELGPRVAPSFDGHLLAVSAANGAIGLWSVRNSRHVVLDATIAGSQQPRTFFFLTGRLLGVVTAAGVLQLWDVSDPRQPVESGSLPGLNAPAATVTYEPGSRTLTAATVLRGNSAGALAGSGSSLWDLADPRSPRLAKNGFDANPDAITWLNGQTMVVITAHGTAIEVWRVRDGTPRSELAAVPIGSHRNPVLQSSPDGRLVAAGYSSLAGGAATIQVWTVTHDQQNLAEFAQLPGDNIYFAFSPASRTLVTQLSPILGQSLAFASSYTQLALYPVGADAVYNQLCRLTRSADIGSRWQHYLPDTYYRRAC